MKAVLDTRFLVAHFFGPPETNKWTSNTLRILQNDGNCGFVPSIVIHEFYKFAFINRGQTIADMRINYILNSELVAVNLDPAIGIEAAKLRCRFAELPTADAIIAATCMATSSDCVLTDDRHLRQIKEIKTRWI